MSKTKKSTNNPDKQENRYIGVSEGGVLTKSSKEILGSKKAQSQLKEFVRMQTKKVA